MNLNYRRKDFIISALAIAAAISSSWIVGYSQGQEAIIKTIESTPTTSIPSRLY